MSIYFVDTSAFAKRYLSEIGSAWIQSWINQKAGNTIIISALGTVEFVSLLSRRQREGNISATDLSWLQNDFLVHVRKEYRVIPINQFVLRLSRQLVLKYPLRTLDAIQLASASIAARTISSIPIFVSADQKLLAAAKNEGFATDDPNAHP